MHHETRYFWAVSLSWPHLCVLFACNFYKKVIVMPCSHVKLILILFSEGVFILRRYWCPLSCIVTISRHDHLYRHLLVSLQQWWRTDNANGSDFIGQAEWHVNITRSTQRLDCYFYSQKRTMASVKINGAIRSHQKWFRYYPKLFELTESRDSKVYAFFIWKTFL